MYSAFQAKKLSKSTSFSWEVLRERTEKKHLIGVKKRIDETNGRIQQEKIGREAENG